MVSLIVDCVEFFFDVFGGIKFFQTQMLESDADDALSCEQSICTNHDGTANREKVHDLVPLILELTENQPAVDVGGKTEEAVADFLFEIEEIAEAAIVGIAELLSEFERSATEAKTCLTELDRQKGEMC